MLVTLFKDKAARTAKQVDLTAEQLRDLILESTGPSKQSLPWLKLAEFGKVKSKKGTLRHDKNVLRISGVELDYDAMRRSFDWGVARLRELNLLGLIYTSPSHQDAQPKWRLLLPTSRPMEPARRVELAKSVNSAFSGIFAPESFALSQSYFYGSVAGNPAHRCVIVPGEHVDLHANLGSENAFTAAVLSIKQPVDPLERLSAMRWKGEGDSGIHNTQLVVSASMLQMGVEEDEVVAQILEATKKVAPPGWDWEAEESAIREMCRDWHKKHPKHASFIKDVVAKNPRTAPPSKARLHVFIGEKILARNEESLIYTAEELWRYRKGLWSRMTTGEARAWIEWEVEEECQALRIPSTTKLASEVRGWLLRCGQVYKEEVKWDGHGQIPTRSGLVHPRTLEVTPLDPLHRCTWRIECDYDPRAECPRFLQMMGDVFADRDPEVAMTLQEVLGTALLPIRPRALTKALVLLGPSNSGKSNVLSAMAGLLCDEENATPFDMLENPHGLQRFLKRAPWVLHEAFDQSKWHFSSTVKALLSGDPVGVNIKNGPMVTLRFSSPVFWGTNTQPQFKEASRAIINRMIVFECKRVFDEDVGASAEAIRKGYRSASEMILAEEKPGLLNWAIVGMQRALSQGSIRMIEEARAILEQVRLDSNLVAGFIDECVEFSEASEVSVADFCASFSIWWGANEGEDRRLPSNKSIGRAVAALGEKRIKSRVSNSKRFYVGIKLNAAGLDYWNGMAMSNVASHKAAGLSGSDREVNREIPFGAS